MRREMKEETGLEVEIERLLYICDRIDDHNHVVHITFLLRKTGGVLKLGSEPEETANPITGIKMVPIMELEQYGFSKQFSELVKSGFPESGDYKKAVRNIGL